MKNKISLIEYLKTYTAIPIKFIEEYYDFYKMCYKRTHGIPIEYVIKYLGITNEKKFVERLKEKYIEKIDYVIIRKVNKKLMKGDKQVLYFLSFDCFEKICMVSKTNKGNDVRDYFLQLRKHINYYRNKFAEKINSMVEKGKGVYILLVNKNKNILKLGQTQNIRKRLQAYSTGRDKHPDINFIFYTEDPKKLESCVKIFAKVKKVRGKTELYKMDIDVLKKLIFDCAELNMNLYDSDKLDDTINKYDAYVVFDSSDAIEYLNTKGEVIGYEKIMVDK
jgi:phage anti-repressor protein